MHVPHPRKSLAFPAVCLIAWLAGCASPGDATLGAQGHVELAYVDGFRSCVRDCTLDTALATDGEAIVRIVNLDEVGALEAVSADEAVLEVRSTFLGEHWRLMGHGPGETELSFLRRGDVLDTFVMRVRDVNRIDVVGAPDRVTAAPAEVRLELFDLQGQRLRGFGAVVYEATENLSVTPASFADRLETLREPLSEGSDVNAERLFVAGDLRGGTGSVLLTAGLAREELELDVVAPEVRSITLRHTEDLMTRSATVTARFTLANEEPGVYACCDWSVEPGPEGLTLTQRLCASVRVARTSDVAPERPVVVCASRGLEARREVSLPPLP